MARYLSGKSGTVVAAGTTLNITKWGLSLDVDLQEVTNSGSGGFREKVPGIVGGAGSFTANWDATLNVAASPPNLDPSLRQKISLSLYFEAGSTFYNLNCFVKTLKIDMDVMGKVTYEASFESTGQITLPSGSF